ncbi:hypothetical protein ACOMHN_032172 [Nucella lapillus]
MNTGQSREVDSPPTHTLSTPWSVSAAVPSHTGTEEPSPSSDSTTVIVAVVLAVLTLILGLLVLLACIQRRRGRRVCGACFRDDNGKERGHVTSANNGMDFGDSRHAEPTASWGDVPLRHHVTFKAQSERGSMDETSLAQNQENECSVIQMIENEDNAAPFKCGKHSGCSLDQILPELAKRTTASSPPDDYNTLNFHAKPHPHPNSPVPLSDVQAEYNHLSTPGQKAEPENDEAAPVYHWLEDQPDAEGTETSSIAPDPKYGQQNEMSAVYHILEEDPCRQECNEAVPECTPKTASPRQQQHQQQGQQQHQQQHGQQLGEGGLYHILEPDTRENADTSTTCIYEIPDTAGINKASAGPRHEKGKRGQILGKQTSPRPKDPTGDYSSLDVQGVRTQGEENQDLDAASVYNHLNEHLADVYSGLNRARREDIVDNDYSHVVY